MPEDRVYRTPRWLVIACALFGVLQFVLGVGMVWALIMAEDAQDRTDEQVAANTRAGRVIQAERCVNDHEDAIAIREAIAIVPDVIVELSRGDPESDPVQLQAFIDGINARVGTTIETPACDLDAALDELTELGVEP